MQQSIQPSANKHLLEIWTQPRAVIRDILDTDPGKYTVPIMILAGAIIGLRSGLIGVPVGAIMAFIILYLYAFLLRWVGGWFGGQGTSEELRAATVWGYYLPTLQWRSALLILTALSNVLQLTGISYVLLAFMAIMTLWTLTIYCRAVAEAHQLSIPRAVLSLLIVVFISAAPFVIAFFALGGSSTFDWVYDFTERKVRF